MRSGIASGVGEGGAGQGSIRLANARPAEGAARAKQRVNTGQPTGWQV
jgi:hypothetical protein